MYFLERARLGVILVATQGGGGDLDSVVLLLLKSIKAELTQNVSVSATDLEQSFGNKFDI